MCWSNFLNRKRTTNQLLGVIDKKEKMQNPQLIVDWLERSTDRTGRAIVWVSVKTIAFAIRLVDRWVSQSAQPNLQELVFRMQRNRVFAKNSVSVPKIIGGNTVKIILSRKGFDSSNGGYPSPVLPDGKFMSLPIPIEGESLSYEAITAPGGKSYAEIIEELAAEAYIGSKRAHLDPDLVASVRPRLTGWRPAFGQCEAAAGHLDNQCVSEGDLFLFFGWFQHTEEISGQLGYRRSEESFHAIFGYMEIGEIISSKAEINQRSWLHSHPHAKLKWANDRIYAASPNLSLYPTYPGGGVFEFNERLRLTKKGESNRSHWNLDPKIFQKVRISYHSEASWKDGYFQSAGRGQEFVIHADEDVIQWSTNLIKNSCL